MYNCNNCSLSFVNKVQLKEHVRNNHQSSVLVSFNGLSKFVERSSNNCFHCPKCNLDFKNPQSIRRHASCFFDSSTHTSMSMSQVPDDPSSEEVILEADPTLPETMGMPDSGPFTVATIPQTLARLYLAYDQQNRIMVCTKCSTVLNVNYVEHTRKVHSRVVSPSLVEFIQSNLPISTFQINLAFPISAIPQLPIVEGFQCPTCKWCCTNKKSMTEHYKSHANNSYIKLCLQSISKGCCLTFFPVVPPPSLEPPVSDYTDVTSIVEAVSTVARAPALVPENDKTRNMLYTTAGWFTNEAEFQDLKELDIHSYFECPVEFTESKTSLKSTLKISFKVWVTGM